MRCPPRPPARPAPIAQRAASIARHVDRACLERLARAGAPCDHEAPTVARASAPLAPAVLAAALPAGPERAAMQTVYERCLAHYRDAVRPEDSARGVDDAGAAAAHFVAENVRALHGDARPARPTPALRRQLGALLRTAPVWTQGSQHERQLCVETLATLAVFVHEAADRALLQGDAAVERVRAAARGYLNDLLGVDPGRVAVGADGLTLRPLGAPARAGI